MKTIIIAVLLFAGGCIGAPFTLEESESEPEVLVIETGPAVYPTGSAVVPAPKPTRHAPDGGAERAP